MAAMARDRPNLKHARTARGLSANREARALHELALEEGIERELGVDGSLVYRWEEGKVTPGPLYVYLLCRFHDKSPAEIDLTYEWPWPVDPRNAGLDRVIISPNVQTEDQEEDTNRREFAITAAAFVAATIADGTVGQANSELWERFLSERQPGPPLSSDVFDHFLDVIDHCWGLLNAGDAAAAELILSGLLPNLTGRRFQQSGADVVVAHGLRLLSVVRAHDLKLHEKIALCQRAVEHARRSGDENAIAASLTELGVAFKYAGQSENSFVSHQEALAHAAGAQPLVRSRVHAASAAAFAQRQVADEFLRHIHLAHEVLPVRPELEPHTLSADYGIHLLAFYEGVAYMSLGRPGDALRTFNEFELDPSAQHTPLRNRLEVVNQQGRAAIMSNDIEMYVRFLEAGISGAIAIGSRKRFDEAMSICRDNVPADWLRDRRVRSILEPFNARVQT